MDIHFYITSDNLERYKKEGSCFITTNKHLTDGLFHISFNVKDHIIEKTLGDYSEYILRKIN